MIVDAAVLADFPTDGHALEDRVFENEIAGVVAFGEEKVFFERFGADGMVEDIGLDGFEIEVALRKGGEALDPVCDGELLDGELFWHGRKIITPKRSRYTGKEEIREEITIFCRVIAVERGKDWVAGIFYGIAWKIERPAARDVRGDGGACVSRRADIPRLVCGEKI
jgi:hypothetical protein